MQFFSNKIGCMHLPQQNIQPIYMLFNSYILAFYRCLRRPQGILIINVLLLFSKLVPDKKSLTLQILFAE